MTERQTKRQSATWVRTVAESFLAGVRPALVIGAWLVLTILFTVVGVSLVITALGQSQGVASFLVALVGVLSACAVSPTLAQAVVVAAVERLEAALDRDVADPDSWLFGLCDMKGRDYCRTSRDCCC